MFWRLFATIFDPSARDEFLHCRKICVDIQLTNLNTYVMATGLPGWLCLWRLPTGARESPAKEAGARDRAEGVKGHKRAIQGSGRFSGRFFPVKRLESQQGSGKRF